MADLRKNLRHAVAEVLGVSVAGVPAPTGPTAAWLGRLRGWLAREHDRALYVVEAGDLVPLGAVVAIGAHPDGEVRLWPVYDGHSLANLQRASPVPTHYLVPGCPELEAPVELGGAAWT